MTAQSPVGDSKSSLDVAPIGNGRIAALVDTQGRIVWWCFPRLDSDPVFSRLLAGDEEKGFCDVVLQGQSRIARASTCATRPSSRRCSRMPAAMPFASPTSRRASCASSAFHPAQIIRRIEPLRGLPRIKHPRATDLQLRRAVPNARPSAPTTCAMAAAPMSLRVTTDAPLSYIAHETPFALIKPVTLDPWPGRAVRSRGR